MSSSGRTTRKCEECRRRKVKCTPVERDWTKRERCQLCVDKHLPCGPPTMKAVRTRSLAETQRESPELVTTPIATWDTRMTDIHVEPNRVVHTPRHVSPITTREHLCMNIGRRVSWLNDMIQMCRSFHISQHACLQRQEFLDLAIGEDGSVATKTLHEKLQWLTDSCIWQIDGILHQISQLSGFEQELLLLKLRNVVWRVNDTWSRANQSFSVKEFRIRQIRILRNLIEFYKNCDDVSETDAILVELATLCDQSKTLDVPEQSIHPSCSVENLGAVFTRSAKRCTSIWKHGSDYRHRSDTTHGPLNAEGTLDARIEFSPIFLAWQAGHPGTAWHLLNTRNGSGEQLFWTDGVGRNLLHRAVEHHDLDSAKKVFRVSCKTASQRDCFRMTPLHVAAHVGDLDIFKLLYEYAEQEPEILEPEITGRTVLSIAARSGQLKIVRFLVSKGPGCHDRPSCSPLHDAATRGHFSVVKLLLEHEANPLIPFGGKKASDAARANRQTKTADLLCHAESVALRKRIDQPEAQRAFKTLQQAIGPEVLKLFLNIDPPPTRPTTSHENSQGFDNSARHSHHNDLDTCDSEEVDFRWSRMIV